MRTAEGKGKIISSTSYRFFGRYQSRYGEYMNVTAFRASQFWTKFADICGTMIMHDGSTVVYKINPYSVSTPCKLNSCIVNIAYLPRTIH